MKQILLFFMLSYVTIAHLNGQSWVSNNSLWHYNFYGAGDGFYKIEMGTDSLIQNKNCQQFLIKKYIFWRQPNNTYTLATILDEPSQYTYTSGDTVFYLNEDKFYMLFNFNANIGDEWVLSNKPINFPGFDSTSKVKVTNKSIITINGKSQRAIFLQTIDRSQVGIDGWVVEKIGPINTQYLFPSGKNSDSTVICYELGYFKCFNDSLFGLYNPNGIDCEYLLNHVGINENKEQVFDVFPNPSSEKITLNFSIDGEYQATIYDLSNKVVLSKNFKSTTCEIDLTGLSKGVYTLKIKNKDSDFTSRKIIKN